MTNEYPHNPFNDLTGLRLGDRLKTVADELRSLGHDVPACQDLFTEIHGRYSDAVGTYGGQVGLVREEASQRRKLRATLLEALHTAWSYVPTVGTQGRRKPALQVQEERQLLFPSGRPKANSPGDDELIRLTDALVSVLTGESALASAWPLENLRAILEARDAFVPVFQRWTRLDAQRRVQLNELEVLRSAWYDRLVLLRNAVQRASRLNRRPNRFASFFRYRKPSQAAVAEEEEKPEPKPETPPPDPTP